MVSFARTVATFFIGLAISKVVNGNDECQNAVEVASFPFQDNGDVMRATADFVSPTDNFRNLTCGISVTAPGVWYRISSSNEEGAFLKATVTDSPTTDAKFITALFKSASASCDDLDCMEPRTYTLENERTQPTMTWYAESKEVYYLHVAGVNENERGLFILDVEVREHGVYSTTVLGSLRSHQLILLLFSGSCCRTRYQ